MEEFFKILLPNNPYKQYQFHNYIAIVFDQEIHINAYTPICQLFRKQRSSIPETTQQRVHKTVKHKQTDRQHTVLAQSTPRCAGLAQGLAHYQVSGELTLRFSRISSMYSSWTFSSRTIFPSSCPSSSHLQINRVKLRKAGEFSPIHLPVFGFNNFFFSPA